MSPAGREVPADEHATTVVRLFCGYADSVVWFSEPVPYADTHLSAGLVADLRAWEAAYGAGLAAEHAWRSDGLSAEHQRSGARLARRLADEIGDEFQVQHDHDGGHRRVRGAGPARNPGAAAAFRAIADRNRRERWGTAAT